MKSLLIVRHAKSDWENTSLSDFQRPLNSRGHRNAVEMAERLKKKKIIPDGIVTSSAVRALTTANYFADILSVPTRQFSQEPSIYEATLSTLKTLVTRLDPNAGFIALFGHNPGMTSLACELSGDDLAGLPTCGMVLLDFHINAWELAAGATATVRFIDYPKNNSTFTA